MKDTKVLIQQISCSPMSAHKLAGMHSCISLRGDQGNTHVQRLPLRKQKSKGCTFNDRAI